MRSLLLGQALALLLCAPAFAQPVEPPPGVPELERPLEPSLPPPETRELPPAPPTPPKKRTPEREPGEPLVLDLRVEGNRKVDDDAVRAVIITVVGDTLDRARLREDVKAIYRLGFFADVVVEAVPEKGGLALVYRVVERPALRNIEYLGNDDVSTDTIKGLVDIKPFTILSDTQVRRNREKIRDKYLDEGYYLAEVTYELREVGPNEVDLVFLIDERSKVMVKKINILGNERVPDAVIKDAMQTREGGFFSKLTGSGNYKEENFRVDMLRLQAVYFDQGFINVKVSEPEVRISPDKRFLYITVRIDEGEQYSLGEVDYSGQYLIGEGALYTVGPNEIRSAFTLTRGEVFNRTRFQEDLQKVTDLYRDQGYAYANVTPISKLDGANRIVNFTLDVDLGQKVYFERINITGNTRTRDKVIRRELRIYEGDLYSETGKRASRARIMRLGYFERAEITQQRGSSDDQIIVNVEVKEKATGTFQVGAGFSSVENFIFTAQISQNNFLGWGQTVSLAAQLSFGDFGRQIIQLQFVEPYFFDEDLTLSLSAYNTERRYFDFVRRSTGGNAGLGFPLLRMLWPGLDPDDFFRAFFTYSLEYVNVDTSGSTSSAPSAPVGTTDGLTSSIRTDIQWDSRDNRLFPSGGFYHFISVEWANSLILSQLEFTKLRFITRFYHSLFEGVVFKTNARLGFIFGDEVPISERFFLGGIASIRGFTPFSLGPSEDVISNVDDPMSEHRSRVKGGDKELLLNLELEFPIFEQAGIRGVLFFDAGNAYGVEQNLLFISTPDSDKQVGYSIGDNGPMQLPLGLYYSVGFGVRWFSPIGPLRFEWGIPLVKRAPLDDNILFEFTIGNFF